MNYETVIGLEVHVQLKTKTKIFCGCSTVFGSEPNSQVCPVCLGLPGVLPVLNKRALDYAIMTGLALNCSISHYSKFDRKNYFYPDLPKGYQISQFDKPVAENGYIDVITENHKRRINIKRAHLEEDAGKLIHAENGRESYVDFNRCGIPLLEIVTEPDIRCPEEAYNYLIKLKQIVKYLDASDCNMQEGSLRCDANVSLRPVGSDKLGVKTEVKNMNSFKGVQKALSYEVGRQKKLLDQGQKIEQDTRLWDAGKEKTYSMRSKEEAHDYRYFPEPDLMPVSIPEDLIEETKDKLPELPEQRRHRFVESFSVPEYDAQVLTSDRHLADYFEAAAKKVKSPKLISNWIMSELLRDLNNDRITADKSPVKPENLGKLVNLIENGKISGKIAKTVFEQMYQTGKDPESIVKEKNLIQISDKSELNDIIDSVIKDNEKSVNDYRTGKETAIMYLVGQVMRATRGKANPKIAQETLKEKLTEN